MMKRAGVLVALAVVLGFTACERTERRFIGDRSRDPSPYTGLREGERVGNRETQQLHGGGQKNLAPQEIGDEP